MMPSFTPAEAPRQPDKINVIKANVITIIQIVFLKKPAFYYSPFDL